MSAAGVIGSLVFYYEICIFIYVLLSWFQPKGIFYDIYRILGQICEPFIGIFRRIVPTAGGFDFSPIVAILVLRLLTGFLLG